MRIITKTFYVTDLGVEYKTEQEAVRADFWDNVRKAVKIGNDYLYNAQIYDNAELLLPELQKLIAIKKQIGVTNAGNTSSSYKHIPGC